MRSRRRSELSWGHPNRATIEALKKTNGSTDSDALMAAMTGLAWESPRGPMSIDPLTRDVIHNIYIRKVEKVNGELYNVAFATFEAVKSLGVTGRRVRSPFADGAMALHITTAAPNALSPHRSGAARSPGCCGRLLR
jgi:hypothetical protein